MCKVEGMKNIRRKRLGHALNWALQSQDPGFATFLADKVLEFYAHEGLFYPLDLLDNLGSCMLVCDRLTFLGNYYFTFNLNSLHDNFGLLACKKNMLRTF